MGSRLAKICVLLSICAQGAMVLTGCGSTPTQTTGPTVTQYAFVLTALPGPFTLTEVENLFEIVATEADPPLDPLLLRVSVGVPEKTSTVMTLALTGDSSVGDKWGKNGILTVTEPSAGYLGPNSLGITFNVIIEVLSDSIEGTGAIAIGAMTWTAPLPASGPTN